MESDKMTRRAFARTAAVAMLAAAVPIARVAPEAMAGGAAGSVTESVYSNPNEDPACGGSAIPVPDGFRWNPAPLALYRKPNGTIATDWDVSAFVYTGAGKAYYVSLSAGSDANDGLTLGTAFQSVSKALLMPDVDIVYIDEGVYPRKHAFNSTTIPRSVSLIALPGKTVVLGTHDLLAWTAESGLTATYRAARSSVGRVFDAAFTDRFGDYTELTVRGSAAEVGANPGSVYSDGTYVWVRTADSRPPDARLRVFLAVKNANIEGGKTIYAEGIRFEGGTNPFRAANSAAEPDHTRVYVKNCKFKYASATNGFHILGTKECFSQNCEAARNRSDGFNYHHYNGKVPAAVEVGNIGRHNGIPGETNQNGSTSHDGATVIRVNGMYFDNIGPNVADVDAGTHSWNVGCVSYDSRVGVSTTQNVNWQNYGSGNSMWLDDCISIGSLYDLYTSSSAAIYTRNVRSNGFWKTNGATISAY
ncbi:hypothetical protein PAESOLCIP111_00461 [Paenibacillus solanacearum]|uniref:Right-handed parallel beta-helix repeat-containing protein n=1 Tax=Paenibacillus solanacearum TaxID=2048548 RepID=A0A916JTB5_9BACL|nr:hypothetical protein [Paenibacillus solanacearum]CAG7601163.1 hypothetical protein PAESOLCIP111_00461 [Paenibacillus solanacearum]